MNPFYSNNRGSNKFFLQAATSVVLGGFVWKRVCKVRFKYESLLVDSSKGSFPCMGTHVPFVTPFWQFFFFFFFVRVTSRLLLL